MRNHPFVPSTTVSPSMVCRAHRLDLGWTNLAALAALILVLTIPSVSAAPVGKGPEVTVLTRNLYVGASFNDIVLEPDPGQIPLRVAETYGRIMTTDFPARAEALADEIARTAPELVALQEVSLIRVQQPGDYLAGNPVSATLVTYDYLEILLLALQLRGTSYEVASQIENLDVELPMAVVVDGTFLRMDDIRLTDRDVILVRGDLKGGFKVKNPTAGHYETTLVLPLGAGVPVLRGWCAVDVRTKGAEFRFLNTHLEDSAALVRLAQATELLNGPASTDLPVIAVGDFNSDANGAGDDGYGVLVGPGGFQDAWKTLAPADPGKTCCQAELLLNETSELYSRIDLILYRGGQLSPLAIELLGEDPADRTPSWFLENLLLWPSDHAGLVASMGLK